MIHQIFIFCAVGFAFLQIFTLSGIHGGNVKKPSGTGIKDLINAAKNMIGNKKFRSFVAVALFFYICWHLDWTVYFIGQTKYVGLDEFWLSISNCASALAQFLTIGLWARRNEKKGVRSGMIIGAVGLMLAPLSIVIPVLFQPGVRPIMHVILRAVFDLTCANVSLNILQCLLQVIGEENRTLSIAVYTLIIAVSNAIMPVVGVGLYTALGANEFACIAFFSICTCVRVFTVLAWYLRWRSMRGEPDR